MWMIEATIRVEGNDKTVKFGPMDREKSREFHSYLSNSGHFYMVRSYLIEEKAVDLNTKVS